MSYLWLGKEKQQGFDRLAFITPIIDSLSANINQINRIRDRVGTG